MQKLALLIGFAALTFHVTSGAKNSPIHRSVPGAYTTVAVTEPNVQSAATFVVDAETKRRRADEQSAALELVEVLSAEQQVVAGINYRLRLRVKQDGQDRTAIAVVWWQAWRQPDPFRLISWEWN